MRFAIQQKEGGQHHPAAQFHTMLNPTTIKRVSEIAKDLANGKERDEIVAKFGKKWQKQPRTIDRLIKSAKIEAEKLRNLANNAATEVMIAETQEAVKQGLKTKLERVLFYQNEIDNMVLQLEGKKEFTFKSGPKLIKSHSNGVFNCPIEIQNELRQQIKSYQSEISKLQGDYAPIETSNRNENINLPLPSDKEVRAIAKALEKEV